jgi:hypothetical protein
MVELPVDEPSDGAPAGRMVPPLVPVGLADRLVLADAADGVLDHVRGRTWLGAGRAAWHAPPTAPPTGAERQGRLGALEQGERVQPVEQPADDVLTRVSRQVHVAFTPL